MWNPPRLAASPPMPPTMQHSPVARKQRRRRRAGRRAEALNLALEGARARAGAKHLAGVDGVLGTLLDVIEIDDGWEPAVEAALGEALQAVVVATPDTGRRALQSLQASNVHGAVLALGARPAGAHGNRRR